MYQVEVVIESGMNAPTLADCLITAAQATLSHQGAPAGELSILITNDQRMGTLNQEYRGVAGSTDVLAFPAGEQPDLPGQPYYIGDIAISLPRARLQATERGHTLEKELQLLVVHGVLHLLGHDHACPDDKALMWSAQRDLLAALGGDPTTA